MRIRLQSGPITLYAQVATILRDRIISGAWPDAQPIPTLDDLAKDLSVARVTVRQAIQMLSGEGLLSSHRGRRTFVTYDAGPGDRSPLFRSVGTVDSENADYSAVILSRDRVAMLPPGHEAAGTPAARYIRLRKVDSEGGVPYVVSDNYVASQVASRFPKNAERRIKVSRLVRDYAAPPLEQATEVVTIGAVGYEDAVHLQIPLSSMVAKVTRTFIGAGQQVAYLGLLVYRSDRFRMERDISSFVRR